MSPMPIPALNIIAIHDTVRNSGVSSSRPRGILPYLLIASQSAKTTNALAARTKAQPPPVMTPARTALATALSESVPNTPQAMNARTSAAATLNTTRSNGKCSVSASSWSDGGSNGGTTPASWWWDGFSVAIGDGLPHRLLPDGWPVRSVDSSSPGARGHVVREAQP